MKDDRRRRRKPRAVLLPHTNPRRFVVKHRPRLSKLTDYPELDFADYERRLASLQGVLQLIQQAYLGSSERALIVLEGWDTAGKGGVVRRLGWALDPRSFKVHPISAPDEHESAEHYLQRFWRHLPQKGQIVVFDRSWYGRVLVERVEGFATEAEWRRGYREINEFERVLTDSGVRRSSYSCTLHRMSRSVVSATASSIPSSDGSCPTRIFAIAPAGQIMLWRSRTCWKRHQQNLHPGT